jgi:hypothetical protein
MTRQIRACQSLKQYGTLEARIDIVYPQAVVGIVPDDIVFVGAQDAGIGQSASWRFLLP